MRNESNSLNRGLVAVAVVLAIAGSAHAATREGRDQPRERTRDTAIIKMVKKIVRALGDGLTVPLP